MQREALLLTEMISAIERIIEICAGGSSSDIESVPDRREALLWNFTVLGEAANQLPDELKSRHPQLPWADASRTRNRIVHGYWSVDFDLLMAIASDDLPLFLSGIKTALDSLSDRS